MKTNDDHENHEYMIDSSGKNYFFVNNGIALFYTYNLF